MGLPITSLEQLDSDVVSQAQDELSQFLQEQYPELELRRGVIHDIVAFFAGGISGGFNQANISRVLASRSLLALQSRPDLATPELVDHVLSNFKITRRVGTRSRGEITIVVEGNASAVAAGNALFSSNGVNYRTDEAVVALPPGSTPGVDERVLEPRGDGTFEFSVTVTAEDVGEAGNARSGSKFIPDPAPARFVTAYAGRDFIGGTSSETNEQLIERMELGIPAETMSGRLNIIALLKSQPVFGDTKNYSVIGYGDPEMSRDQHWIFPVSGGGRIDIYAQTEALPRTVTLRKTCSLVSVENGNRVWQFSVGRDDAPGFYSVEGVRRPEVPLDVGGLQITSDVRGWDFANDDWRPDIKYTQEALYTRYQTAVMQFIDPQSSLDNEVVGATREYNVSLVTQPLIRELQEFVSNPDYRHLSADVLVKAAVPCFLTINFDIVKNASESSPDTAAIVKELVRRVNNIGFTGQVYGSQIADTVHDFLTPTMALSDFDLHTAIRRPDGTKTIVRGTQELTLVDSPSTLTTPNTTILVLYPENIGINVVNRSN